MRKTAKLAVGRRPSFPWATKELKHHEADATTNGKPEHGQMAEEGSYLILRGRGGVATVGMWRRYECRPYMESEEKGGTPADFPICICNDCALSCEGS